LPLTRQGPSSNAALILNERKEEGLSWHHLHLIDPQVTYVTAHIIHGPQVELASIEPDLPPAWDWIGFLPTETRSFHSEHVEYDVTRAELTRAFPSALYVLQ
jgi:hypothetical protein